MKKVSLLVVFLIAINIAFQMLIAKNKDVILLLNLNSVESLSETESPFDDCIGGGPGSVSCKIEGKLEGFEGSCEVSCGGDYWSCCSIKGCHCRR